MIQFAIFIILWYGLSVSTVSISKIIMIEYGYALTLTLVQFGFSSVFSIIVCYLFPVEKLIFPNRQIILSTLPLGIFQILGQVFASSALSYIPVSFSHTIKVFSIHSRLSRHC